MTLEEMMNLPYSMVIKKNKLFIVELGIHAEASDLNVAIVEINSKKNHYFREMIDQRSIHLIPTPLIWRKKFFPIESYDIKRTCAKALIYAAIIGIVLLAVTAYISKQLEKNLKKAEEIVRPVVQSEQLKTEIFIKNIEKYRPYIREVVKVWEEEKKVIK